jgi:hypothetical protein
MNTKGNAKSMMSLWFSSESLSVISGCFEKKQEFWHSVLNIQPVLLSLRHAKNRTKYFLVVAGKITGSGKCLCTNKK